MQIDSEFATTPRCHRHQFYPPAFRSTELIRSSLVLLIQGYKSAISPYLPTQCRYEPTCSQFAIEALQFQGVAKGLWLALKRIARCHPGRSRGYDPVPGKNFRK